RSGESGTSGNTAAADVQSNPMATSSSVFTSSLLPTSLRLADRAVACLSIKTYSLPMARVIVIAFSGAQTLDVCGPSEVFSSASILGGAPYEIVLASRAGGGLRTMCGFEIKTIRLDRLRPRASDTILVAGGDEAGTRASIADRALLEWL